MNVSLAFEDADQTCLSSSRAATATGSQSGPNGGA